MVARIALHARMHVHSRAALTLLLVRTRVVLVILRARSVVHFPLWSSVVFPIEY